jgi:membrane-bound ClpP family serine protease
MLYLGLYLLVGAIAFIWTLTRRKTDQDDILVLLMVFVEPWAWLAWLLWPVALPYYWFELQERARQRSEKAKAEKLPEPERLNLIGIHATAVTRMSPTGVVKIADNYLEARSEDGFIDSGESVVIIAERDSRLIVRRASAPSGNSEYAPFTSRAVRHPMPTTTPAHQ